MYTVMDKKVHDHIISNNSCKSDNNNNNNNNKSIGYYIKRNTK